MSQRGHVRRVGRVWRLIYRQPRELGGPIKQKSVRLGTIEEIRTAKAARESADRFLAHALPWQLHSGTVLEWPAWCDRFIHQHLSKQAQGTRESQGSIIDCHLRPAFDCPVHRIDVAAAQRFIDAQHAAGVAPATIKTRFSVLRKMIRQAVDDGLAVKALNVRDVKLPKEEKDRPGMKDKAFSPAEVGAILNAAPDPAGTAFALAAYAGLRCGEVLGMCWGAIDLEQGTLAVRRQAIDGELRVLKAKCSSAMLSTPAPLLERLRGYRTTWIPNAAGLLFADEHGEAWHPPVLLKELHALLEQLGIRRRGMHAFRHSCALAMAATGANPEVLRRAMRHGSLRTTSEYLEATPADIAEGLERGAAWIIRKNAPKRAA